MQALRDSEQNLLFSCRRACVVKIRLERGPDLRSGWGCRIRRLRYDRSGGAESRNRHAENIRRRGPQYAGMHGNRRCGRRGRGLSVGPLRSETYFAIVEALDDGQRFDMDPHVAQLLAAMLE